MSSSRYPPAPRDRSPPRYDRRTSNNYTPLGSSYRGQADSAPASSQREPPRGPKADFRGGGAFPFSPAPRGRGTFPARAADTWDRDRERERDRDRERDRERDPRPAPQSYRGRDDDRADWSRRDRDFVSSDRGVASAREPRPYVGRERSASPARPRRDSRESIPSTFGRPSDSTSSYYTPAARGGLGRGGRGRGDWDRARGRSSFVGERDRDLFHPRSRSRESWRDRDFDRGRPPPGEVDRPDRYDRREYDRSREREVRGRDQREHDLWPREQSPSKSSIGNTAPPASTPSASASDRPAKADLDGGKRPSLGATPTSAAREGRREGEQADYFGSRVEVPRRDAPQASQQPAVAALDYGPPPSVTTPAAEKPATVKPQPPKLEQATPVSTPFQPPSGPKAVRTASATSLNQSLKTPQHNDNWPRAEPGPRPARPSLTPTTSTISTEGAQKKDDPPAESKPPAAPAADRAMPPNVPSGPRLGTAPSFKPKPPSSEPTGPAALPTAPRELSKPVALDNRPPAIPTGPRLDREVARPLPGTGSKIWVSPDYKPKPSIMNALNKPYQPESRDRPGFIPTGPRQQSAFHGSVDKGRPLQASPTSVPSAPSGPKALLSTSPRMQDVKMTLLPPRQHLDELSQPEDVEMSVPASSEDEDEADDSFDEDYFAESEERFRQEMDLLEARKPPPILQDGAIVSLLIKLQFLEMIMQDSVPRPSSSPIEVAKDEAAAAIMAPTGLPSPDRASNESDAKLEVEPPHPKGRPLKQPPVNPIPTPPIEDLPYLKQGPSERQVFEDSDNEVEQEAVSILLQQEFERNAWDWRSDIEDTRADFRRMYPLWKQEVAQLEQERREQQASPAPASPAPSVAPSVTPSLTHERTRGARNTTEADLQAAILMSQQSLKEEEERREREAASNSLPNYDTEAVVPSMLKPVEVELSRFEDTNRLIPHGLTLDVFAYLPPEDDFTDEEQTLFITAYCQHPKKWGKIAESLPDRSYQDCIAHYYLTKNQARYKDIWRRSQPRKRRGRAATKPRSTALMSELVYGEDSEAAPVAVTDSGRPRRAAAPTFGDTASEVDSSTPVPQSKKLTAALKDGNADPSVTKPTRGRKAGIATKTRRTKAQIQADQQALLHAAEASPGKLPAAGKAERGRPLLRAENVPIKTDPVPITSQSQRPVEAGLQQYPLAELQAVPAVVPPQAPSQVTSYWSVPEQHKFPELLEYYGRDFAAIAEFMKTKSMTMIKNYFLRQINDGKEEFERLAQKGDQARLTGKPLTQPPSPIVPPKRRYEATTSLSAVARHTPQVEQAVLEPEPSVPPIKPAVIEEFPRNPMERHTTAEVAAKPRQVTRDPVMPAGLPPKTEEVARLPSDRATLYGQKTLHGPRSGVFQDDVAFAASRPNMRIQEQSPQVVPQRLGDMPRIELNQQPAMSTVVHNILASREPGQVPPRPPPSAAPLTKSLQTQVDKYGQQGVFHAGHSRNSSSTTLGHGALESAQELSSLRRVENQRSLYGPAAAGSPAPVPTSMHSSQPARADIPQAHPVPAPAEPPKPPAKRSNVFGLLNDDPPDPPPKRPSIEGPKRPSMRSPQITPVTGSQNALQPPRGQLYPEDVGLNRGIRGPYGHGSALPAGTGSQPSADYPGGVSSSNAAGPSTETWMDRFDPRPQGAPPDQRSHHHSPAPSHYSVVPPSSQQSNVPPHHSLRGDAPRTLERPGGDHRRTLLGAINQIPHAPSPPPQQASQPGAPYRSTSSSSQHSRVTSLGYGQSPNANQPASLGHQQGPPTHSQSASSTPVPSLHHRAQSSLDYQPRLTIQQHMAQQSQQGQQSHQSQQSQQKQQEHQREQDRHLHRQRDLEVAQRERERERERERDQQQQKQQQQQQQQQHHLRRDIYGIERHPSPTVTRQNQMGASANQNHMAFAQREIPRTFTPPHAHSHSHTHSQYPPPGGLGHPHNLQLQQQHHQHQLQHQHQHQPGAQASQAQGQGQAQSQAQQPGPGPGPTQPGPPPPHQLHHIHHPPPQGTSILHPGAAGHYRTLSQGEGRRDDRR